MFKLRDYIASLEQVVIQLSTISTTYTSITATSPLGLPAPMSKTLNTNIKHLTTSLIPSLENMFLESKAYVEQRIVRDIFPAFVKQQLSLCTAAALSSEVEGDLPPTPFPGLKCSFCLSDPVKPGNPVVFTSDEFQDLTGYSRAEVMSRNCRLLQGPQTDREAIANVRAALWRGDACSELMLNFRRDGQPFWNLLYLCPMQDAAGKTKFYLGAQIDVSSNMESNDALLKMLSYGSADDDTTSSSTDRSSPRWTNEASSSSTGEPDLEELSTVKSNGGTQNKPAKLSFFKSFKKPLPPPPLSPPLSPRRTSFDRPPSSAGFPPPPPAPLLEKTYSTRTVLKRLSTPVDMATTFLPYSRYMMLEHVPSYPASLGAMPLDQDMRYPPKLSVAFFSQAMVDALDLGMAADAIRGKDVFDVLAEQATLPNVTKAFKSTVRDVVVRDGRAISLDLALTNHIPRRANVARASLGADAGSGGGPKTTPKMMSHWTPLKDADGRVKYVVLVISPL